MILFGKKWLTLLMPLLLAAFISVVIYLKLQFREPPQWEWYGVIWITTLIYLMWWAGSIVYKKASRSTWPIGYHWLVSTFFGMAVFMIGYVGLNLYENEILLLNNPFASDHFFAGLAMGFIIIQLINLVQLGYRMLFNWKEAQLEVERYKQAETKARLENLKAQIDPHFLFNSFSTLQSLMESDIKKATTHLSLLSSLYRSVLEQVDIETVTVSAEMKLTETYIKLLQTRHEDGLMVDVQLDENSFQKMIPSFSIQLLVENAVKHNQVQSTKPLEILIQSDETGVTVSNNYQPKSAVMNSSGLGINNLKERYHYLANQEIHIHKNAQTYSTHLPYLI